MQPCQGAWPVCKALPKGPSWVYKDVSGDRNWVQKRVGSLSFGKHGKPAERCPDQGWRREVGLLEAGGDICMSGRQLSSRCGRSRVCEWRLGIVEGGAEVMAGRSWVWP